MNFHYCDISKNLQGHVTKYWVTEDWQSCTISETARFSISLENSAEIATLIQMAEDCSRCARWKQAMSGRQWSCAVSVGRSVPPLKLIASSLRIEISHTVKLGREIRWWNTMETATDQHR